MKRVALVLVALTLAMGCHKKSKVKTPTGEPSSSGGGSAQPLDTSRPGTSGGVEASGRPATEPPRDEIDPSRLGPILFEYDSSTLSSEAMETLTQVGDYLERHPGATVTIAGNADERGTEEYNLSLGEERARVARDFLVRYRVDGARIKIVSYGEEKPLCTDEEEGCFAKNRRDDLGISGGAVSER